MPISEVTGVVANVVAAVGGAVQSPQPVAGNVAAGFIGGSLPWSNITNKPTTIAGFGITDAYIKNQYLIYPDPNNPTHYLVVDNVNSTQKTPAQVEELIFSLTDHNHVKFITQHDGNYLELPFIRRNAPNATRNLYIAGMSDDETLLIFTASGNDIYFTKTEEKIVHDGKHYPNFQAGVADNLIDRKDIGSSEEIAYRTTHDKISVTEDGNADVQVIKGNTEKFNQLVQNGNFESTSNWVAYHSTNFTVSNNEATFIANTDFPSLRQEIFLIPQHKYLLSAKINAANIEQAFVQAGDSFNFINIQSGWNTISAILTPTANTSSSINNKVFFGAKDSQTGDIIKIKECNAFDLTAMGLDTITTVADFRAKYPKMYGYNAGQLINFNGTSLVTNGFNQWDEQTEIGSIGSDGSMVESSTSLRSKNYCYCIGGQNYYARKPSSFANSVLVAWYDSSNNFIRRDVVNGIFVSPSNASYYKIALYNYGTTYKHDICINLSWSGYRNGQYESYWSNTKSLDFVQTYFPNGMKSAGSAYDEINFKTHKAITRIGSVDLGSLEWGWHSDYNLFSVNRPSFMKSLSSFSCPIYGFSTTDWAAMTNMTLAIGNSAIAVKNSSYTDAQAFKTAMSGVMLYYELATPTEVDIPTSLTCTYPCADFGTERLTPSTYDLLTSPLKAQIHYNLDYTRQIENNILVSGENIKTVNNQSLLGEGNINVGGSASSVTYDNTTSGLEATNVQSATDELSEKIVNLSKEYELIEEITLTEDVTEIVRSQDTQGNAYDLKKTLVFITLPTGESSIQTGVLWVGFYRNNSDTMWNCYFGSSTLDSVVKYIIAEQDVSNGFFEVPTAFSGKRYQYSQNFGVTYPYFNDSPFDGSVNKVRIWATKIPSGTNIKIYAIRN